MNFVSWMYKWSVNLPVSLSGLLRFLPLTLKATLDLAPSSAAWEAEWPRGAKHGLCQGWAPWIERLVAFCFGNEFAEWLILAASNPDKVLQLDAASASLGPGMLLLAVVRKIMLPAGAEVSPNCCQLALHLHSELTLAPGNVESPSRTTRWISCEHSNEKPTTEVLKPRFAVWDPRGS